MNCLELIQIIRSDKMLLAVKKKVALSPTSAYGNNAANTTSNKYLERQIKCLVVSQMTTQRTSIAVRQGSSNCNIAKASEIQTRIKSSDPMVNVKVKKAETQLNLAEPRLKAGQTTQIAGDTENSSPRQNLS